MVNERLEKSGTLAIAPISGVRMSLTRALTTLLKAAPIMTPTARSMTLPRRRNCLNSLSMGII